MKIEEVTLRNASIRVHRAQPTVSYQPPLAQRTAKGDA